MPENQKRRCIAGAQIDALDRWSKAGRGLHADGTPKQPVRFEVRDRLGRRTLMVPAHEPPWTGDPSGIVLDIEARTRTRLRDGGNPNWFIRLEHDFSQRRDPDAGVSFAEYCANRHGDKVDARDKGSAEPEPEPVRFSGRQAECLQGLYQLDATGRRTGVRRVRLSERVLGAAADPDNLKEPLLALKRGGFVLGTSGRSAIWWLTAEGRRAAESIR